MIAAPMTVFIICPRAYEKGAGSAFEIALAKSIASGLTKAKEGAQRAGGQSGAKHGGGSNARGRVDATTPRRLMKGRNWGVRGGRHQRDVRYWHLADIPAARRMSALGEKRT